MMISQALIAHRGWQHCYPENSLEGIEQALKAGAKHIEIDVQLTADHEVILCHDRELSRLSGIARLVHLSTLEQLQELSYHEPGRLGMQFYPSPLCTLKDCSELIRQHPETTLYIEIKRNSIREFSRELIIQRLYSELRHIEDQCMFISFDINVLALATQQYDWDRIAPVLASWQQWLSSPLLSLQPDLVFCDIKLVPENINLSLQPYPIALYEIDDLQQAQYWLSRGAKLIESFSIGDLLCKAKQQNS